MKTTHCLPRLTSRFTIVALAFLVVASVHAEDSFDLIGVERERILRKVADYLTAEPRTVTADICPRSQGGPHDFYSEGDYWWPNPEDPDDKYIRRDGESNPDNFVAHRLSLIRLSDIVGTFASAYVLTNDDRYVAHAIRHLRAWFVDEQTRMNPRLLYGQAIKGRYSGRSIGLIDTIHLVEVARGIKVLGDSDAFAGDDMTAIKGWFREYLTWINSHEYGLNEKQHPNNHGVCWSMQAAAFAELVGDKELLAWIRNQFKTVYIAEMMNEDGSFPAELARTKPYGYSLFMIDAMAVLAHIASNEEDNLWTFQLADGRGLLTGMKYITPYINDKSKWPLPPDVQYWDEWPVRHPCLFLAGFRTGQREYLRVWSRLEADPETYEVLRNLPVRHPLIWVPTCFPLSKSTIP